MSKIIIIHFSPIELYPPLQNLLAELSKKTSLNATVFTTNVTNDNLTTYQSPASHIRIVRIGRTSPRQRSWVRYGNYLLFYIQVLLRIIFQRPAIILYFETLSSWPALIYKRYIRPQVGLFIHYHEYTSIEEYNSGMFLTKYFHTIEKKLYPLAEWVSHTNDFRMTMFKRDILPVKLPHSYLLPNYPPISWKSDTMAESEAPTKIVYAGALSFQTMYLQEFALWVHNQAGKVQWDIYSYNFSTEASQFLSALNSPWIKLKPGVDYQKLPVILKGYRIGVILYRGHIANYVYNAPNKLFEYFACGLDVWFPTVMEGCMPYSSQREYPRVLPVDFSALSGLSVETIINRHGLKAAENVFFAENALEELVDKLVEH